MKKVLAIIALCLTCAVAYANDSAIEGTGGTPTALESLKTVQPLKGEHKYIRMVREKVALTIYPSFYDVVVDFVFTNSGPAQTVLMGFPEGAGGDTDFEPLKTKTAFKKFRTEVDGAEVKAKRIATKYEPDGFDFTAYWVKAVSFRKNQTRNIRVAYRSPLGSSTSFTYADYDFTGGNWKGKVEGSTLSARFVEPGHYYIANTETEGADAKYWHKNGVSYWQWRNWEAQSGFPLSFARVPLGSLMAATDQKTLGITWSAFSGDDFIVSSKNVEANYRGEFAFPAAGIVRDGRTFVSLKAVMDEMRSLVADKQRETKQKQRYGALTWNAKTGEIKLVMGGSKNTVIELKPGNQIMLVDGNLVALPAATFVAGTGDSGAVYVPARELMAAIKGQYQVNTKTRRILFQLPV